MILSNEELVNIIDKALAHFSHSQCPYCEAYIGFDRYIDLTDIEKWVDTEILSKEDSMELAFRDVLNTIKELGETLQSLNQELKSLAELAKREQEKSDKGGVCNG